MDARPKAVVLLSGGVDSTTAAALTAREDFALYALTLAYGQRHAVELEAARRIAPQSLVERMIPLGVLIYAGTGVVGLILGKNYLDYSVFSHDAAHGHELGIFLVEAGVLVTVAGTMTALFYAFVERGR